MPASNSIVIRIVRITTAVLLMGIAGCKREPAPAIASVAESAASRPALADVSVEENPGWAPSFVARQAHREIDACREAIEQRLGLPIAGAPAVLEVRYVHDSETLWSMIASIPRAEQVLRYGVTAFLQPSANRLVFARDAEVPERTYMISLALLLAQYEFEGIWLADSVATWLSGLALSRLESEPLWRRGRVTDELGLDLRLADVREFGPKQLEGLCRWGAKRLPLEADLAWDLSTMAFSDIDLDGRSSGINAIGRLRILSWFVVHTLATFDVADDGRVRFGGTPKYDAELKKLISRRDAVQRDAFCGTFARQGTLASDIDAYRNFVGRKLSLGQVRNGVLIAWDQFTNSKGQKTGQPEDDFLIVR